MSATQLGRDKKVPPGLRAEGGGVEELSELLYIGLLSAPEDPVRRACGHGPMGAEGLMPG